MVFFEKLKQGLEKTRAGFSEKISGVLSAFTRVDEDLLEELEEALILCDMGVETSVAATEALRRKIREERIKEPGEVREALCEILEELVRSSAPEERFPKVILVVGVNGVGKTTSIGKIANLYRQQGKSVLLCAADTFRAAASEQLGIWAERVGVPIVKYGEGADPAAVVYDSLDSAKARGTDVVLCDTAGRLHNKKNLMNELNKIDRVISQQHPEASRETLLVLDATTGQNAIAQAKEFSGVVHVDGLVLTKLDGTARGGVVCAIRQELGIPVRYIGVGEGVEDLQPFDPEQFARALVGGK